MLRIKILSITTIILTAFTACQKSNTVEAQPEEVSMSITSPESGKTYKKNDVVNIKAEISYISQMHGYTVEIQDETGKTVYQNEGHTHGDKITINETWTDTLSGNHELTLILDAIIDHENNTKQMKVNFKSQP